MMPSIMSGSLMRATPPCARMSAGTRSRAITATAPASSAILACSGVTTSMMTPPLSISAMPRLTRAVPVTCCSLTYSSYGGMKGPITPISVDAPGALRVPDGGDLRHKDHPGPPRLHRVRLGAHAPRRTPLGAGLLPGAHPGVAVAGENCLAGSDGVRVRRRHAVHITQPAGHDPDVLHDHVGGEHLSRAHDV